MLRFKHERNIDVARTWHCQHPLYLGYMQYLDSMLLFVTSEFGPNCAHAKMLKYLMGNNFPLMDELRRLTKYIPALRIDVGEVNRFFNMYTLLNV